MKLSYDPEVDALYLSLSAAPVVESEEARPGVVLDLDAQGEVVGIEILHLRQRTNPVDPQKWDFEVDAA